MHWTERSLLASTRRLYGILSISSLCVLREVVHGIPSLPPGCWLLPKTSLGFTFSKALAISSGVRKPLPSLTQPCGCSGHPHRDVALDRQKSRSQEAGPDRGTAGSCEETFPGPQHEAAQAWPGKWPIGGSKPRVPDVCSCS